MPDDTMADPTQVLAFKDMIFVTGASRSGTTMLSRIFGQHSVVNGLKELHCFGELVDPNQLRSPLNKQQAVDLCTQLIARSKRDIWGEVTAEDATEAEQLFPQSVNCEYVTGDVVALTLNHIATTQGKTIPCEQTPRNIFYANALLDYFPSLKIVHIVRDPRDVLASQKNRWKRKRLGGDNIPYSEIIRVWFNYHPYTITKLWVKATTLAQQLKTHERVYILRFEDIIANPEQEIKKVCAFLGLAYESEMLDIEQIGSSHRQNTNQQRGVAQKALNTWVKILTPGEVAICERIAAEQMKAFSYPVSNTLSAFNVSVITQILKYPLHAVGVLISNPRRAWIQLQAILGTTK